GRDSVVLKLVQKGGLEWHVIGGVKRNQVDARAGTEDDVGGFRIAEDIPLGLFVFRLEEAAIPQVAWRIDCAAHDPDVAEAGAALDRQGKIRQWPESQNRGVAERALAEPDGGLFVVRRGRGWEICEQPIGGGAPRGRELGGLLQRLSGAGMD